VTITKEDPVFFFWLEWQKGISMPLFSRKVLVLDARYEPVKVVSMETGFVLVYSGKAQVVAESDRTLRTIDKLYPVPSIIRMSQAAPRQKRLLGPRFSRQNVYLRDDFRCQYCNWTGPIHQLTLDHLIPSSQGGPTTWLNIVTACKTCNLKKGARSPSELGMKLKKPPERPKFPRHVMFALRYLITRNNIPPEWIPYVDLSVTNRLLACVELEMPLSFGRPGESQEAS
jgi:hypothetical protein